MIYLFILSGRPCIWDLGELIYFGGHFLEDNLGFSSSLQFGPFFRPFVKKILDTAPTVLRAELKGSVPKRRSARPKANSPRAESGRDMHPPLTRHRCASWRGGGREIDMAGCCLKVWWRWWISINQSIKYISGIIHRYRLFTITICS